MVKKDISLESSQTTSNKQLNLNLLPRILFWGVLFLNFSNAFSSTTIRQWVEEHNIAVKLARMDLGIAKIEEQSTDHFLDLQVSLSAYRENSHEAQNSSLENPSIRQITDGLSMGLIKEFSFGGKLEASVQSLILNSDSLNVLAPEWSQSAAQVKFKYPLWGGSSLASRQLEKLKAGPKTHRYEVKLQKTIEDKYLKSMEIYFDLYALTNELEQREKNIQLYENLFDYHERMLKLGQTSLVKKYEVEAALEEQRAVYLKKTGKLKNLIAEFEQLTQQENLSASFFQTGQ